MLEDMSGPNQHITFLTPNSNNGLEDTFTMRKGYRRGYTEFGVGAKLHPEKYRHGPMHILSREEIDSLSI